MEPGLNRRFVLERRELFGRAADVSIVRDEYLVNSALDLDDFAPFVAQWNQCNVRRKLPSVSDFDDLRKTAPVAAVHLVDTSSDKADGFRYLEFDCGVRVDGRDFSGIHVAEYPAAEALRQTTLIDYESAARVGRCSLMEVSINPKRTPRKFARLILPISESGSGTADRLLVVVRLLEFAAPSGGSLGDLLAPGVGDAPHPDAADGQLTGPSAYTVLANAARSMEVSPALRQLNAYFQAGQQEHLDDRHLLELILSPFVRGDDVSSLALSLLDEFGSLASVTAMSNERLAEISGLSADLIVQLKAVREIATRLVRQQVSKKNLMSDTRSVIAYCHARMAHETVEHVRVIYLDQKNQLIKDEAIRGGGVSSVPVNPRDIVKRAIVLDAQSIILAHNHPSGDPSPSAADVELTLEIKRAVQAVGMRLIDHLIIGQSGHVSLRGTGYLDIK